MMARMIAAIMVPTIAGLSLLAVIIGRDDLLCFFAMTFPAFLMLAEERNDDEKL